MGLGTISSNISHQGHALLEFVRGAQVHVNLIPFNPMGSEDLRPSPPARLEHFPHRLRASGLPVTVRRSLGTDIGAACGQLVRAENLSIARELRGQPRAAPSSARQ